jgi:8-oxo-dGTP pyrophosphatase MutT (NUDIX family)
MTQYNNPTPIAVHLQEVLDHNGRPGILIIKRADNQEWALPGGYVETDKDKSAEAAAAREFTEELGMIACPGEPFMSTINKAGLLLIFCRSTSPFSPLNKFYWKPTAEVLDWQIVHSPAKMCYPAHTLALQQWFGWRVRQPDWEEA